MIKEQISNNGLDKYVQSAKKIKDINLTITYGSNAITLNQGINHIILSNEKAKCLLNSLLHNLDFEIKVEQ